MNCRYLCLAGRDRHCSLRIYRLDLPIDALNHGLISIMIRLKKPDKLLRTNLIGERPQSFAGTAT